MARMDGGYRKEGIEVTEKEEKEEEWENYWSSISTAVCDENLASLNGWRSIEVFGSKLLPLNRI